MRFTDLSQSDGTGVREDPQVHKNVREVGPNEKSEKSQAQPSSIHPNRIENRRDCENVNNGLQIHHKKQEILSSKSPKKKV